MTMWPSLSGSAPIGVARIPASTRQYIISLHWSAFWPRTRPSEPILSMAMRSPRTYWPTDLTARGPPRHEEEGEGDEVSRNADPPAEMACRRGTPQARRPRRHARGIREAKGGAGGFGRRRAALRRDLADRRLCLS